MNIYVPNHIKDKYPNIVFRRKSWKYKNRKIIEAVNYATKMKFYYSFDEDFFWFKNDIPDWKFPLI
jgi:hypothetical protein